MIDKFCDYLINKMKKNNYIDDEKTEVIKYGLQVLLGEVPKIFIMFLSMFKIISFMTSTFFGVCIFSIFFIYF